MNKYVKVTENYIPIVVQHFDRFTSAALMKVGMTEMEESINFCEVGKANPSRNNFHIV